MRKTSDQDIGQKCISMMMMIIILITTRVDHLQVARKPGLRPPSTSVVVRVGGWLGRGD